MDKKCTSCGKTVYPLEQLKCLDQIWHKQCFKCEVCGMTLNMKNYKGLEKKPYCSAHYPQPKAYTFVSDNPEMQRVKQNTAVISNVKYHEEFEKSKGAKMAVTEDMLLPSAQAAKKQPAPPPAQPTNAAVAKSVNRRGSAEAPVGPGAAAPAAAPGSIFAYDPARREEEEATSVGSAADQLQPKEAFDPHAAKRGSTIYSSEESQQTPVNSSYTGQSTVYTTSAIGRRYQPQPAPESEPDNHHAPAAPSGGAAARYSQNSDRSSPRHSGYGAAVEPVAPPAQRQPSPPPPQPQQYYQPPPSPPAVQQQPPQSPAAAPEPAVDRGRCYRALYDYVAQDDDEVAFNEGDVITNGDPIDEGWMYGIVERTGQYGMLPSNYVEELL